MAIDRRRVLVMAAALPIAGRAMAAAGDDEAYWATIAAHYDVTREVLQLENGNWGMMARQVLEAYQAMVARVNRDTSYYARRAMIGDLEAVRARVAAELGVAADEVMLTRNATEALKALIGGYNRLGPGDALLHADLDYDSAQAMMATAAARRGAELVRIALPEPATQQGLIDAYARPSLRISG